MSPQLITARKRSLGQGNIFTPICHSVHRGVPPPGGLPQGVLPPGECFLGGVLPPGGGCFLSGVPGGDLPGRLLLRAVRILLECILV